MKTQITIQNNNRILMRINIGLREEIKNLNTSIDDSARIADVKIEKIKVEYDQEIKKLIDSNFKGDDAQSSIYPISNSSSVDSGSGGSRSGRGNSISLSTGSEQEILSYA